MLKYYLPLIGIFCFGNSAFADTCKDLKTCAKVMEDMYGQRYIWESGFDNLKFGSSSDIEITRDTGEITFTALLDQLGLARAPVGDGKSYRIVKAAYRKEMETPIFEGSADATPTLPATWDIITLRYKTKTPETARYLEMAFRLHLPRESRMQADENSSMLILTAPAPTVRHMIKVFQGSDRPLTPAMKDRMKKRDAQRMEMPPILKPKKDEKPQG